jgi:hypothetical protein
MEFPAGLGTKTAYRFHFSDQHVVPQTLGIPSVSTRLCFDSEIMTNAIASLKRTVMVRWLQQSWIREKVINLFEKLQWGSEVYVAKVVVAGQLNGRHVEYHGSISGEKEFVTTGKVAAYVAKHVYTSQHPPGVFHMEQLFQPTDLFADLGNIITFNEKILGE